ncbi:hypothetical protein BC833DRAFT_586393 [Globomyces pollinis-pini]|nr:hypothetical protein BC833DRAFT_586393 [Globomyces pollinis-pini]
MTTRIKLLHAVILLKDRDQGVISAQCFESSKGVLGHSDIQSGLSVNLSHSDDDNDSLYEIESRNLDFSKSNLSSIVIPNDAMHLQGEIAEILNSDEIDEPSNNDIIDMEKENDESVEVHKEPKHNSHPDGHNDVEIDTDSQSESTIYQSLSSLNLTTGSSIIPIPERGSREDGPFLSSSQRSSNHLNLAISSSPNKSLRPLSIITGGSFKSQPQSPRPTSPLNAINQVNMISNSLL